MSLKYIMNKAISISMMLCATMILLAHAVVPHHHHDNAACFISPVEEHDHHCCDHDAEQPKDHENSGEDEACLLSDFLALVPDNYKQENYSVEYSNNDIPASLLALLIVHSEDNNTQSRPPEAFRRKVLPDSSYELFISRCLGMRGPPSC